MKIIVHAQNPEALIEQLSKAHPDIDVTACSTYTDLPALLEVAQPDAVYSIRFDGTATFPAKALLGPHGPAWIAVGGSGVDHLGKWDTAQTTVTNAAGVAAEMMAEYVFGSFLHFSLGIPGLQEDKMRRVWSARRMTPLFGKTVLIAGLGHTGRAVAKRAKAFGMTVIGTRARPAPMTDVDAVHGAGDLVALCGQADFIVVSAPLLDSTRNLFGRAVFDAIKPGAVLVDVSRGGVVNAAAICAAMNDGILKGAALDVFETEPLPADSPYWDLPNTLVSPHCSSVFDAWDAASMALFCENVTRWKMGEDLRNVVDPERGY
ncbi:D-2-hydroxyacid dehydrogenase [Roseobacter insulae]|uniref:D-2-hydroxyacid dehydrogenase n=1 Tax=Roseobacter insulae TaxID=2859783 RepID=UPI0027E42D5A|nr:D-2-hydroxyacid dehydrogenase [Roseobacter insulae]